MSNHIFYAALGFALVAGASAANAQTVIAQEPGSLTIAQQPVVTAPLDTVETVRTVQTTAARPRVARHRFARSRTTRRVTTRTTVSERVIPTPAVVATEPAVTPAVAAITQPTYTEVVPAPAVAASTYSAPLYDVVPGPDVVAQPVIGASVVTPVPAYRYVYEPDRILVIDANTGIAVQAIPR